jgi:hypothetical protein
VFASPSGTRGGDLVVGDVCPDPRGDPNGGLLIGLFFNAFRVALGVL